MITKQKSLLLWLLLAPALIWLSLLILLPHLEMLILSLRTRVAPQEYAFSLKQYATFFDEPLYWHTFLRTAILSLSATAISLVLAFPVAGISPKSLEANPSRYYWQWYYCRSGSAKWCGH